MEPLDKSGSWGFYALLDKEEDFKAELSNSQVYKKEQIFVKQILARPPTNNGAQMGG